MSEYMIKVTKQDGTFEMETLFSYCLKLGKRNNKILFLLEDYLNKKLLDEPELAEIRDIILTVSAEIVKIPQSIEIVKGE